MSYYDTEKSSDEDISRSIIEQLRIQFDLNYDTCHQCAHLVLSSVHSFRPNPELSSIIKALNHDSLDIENCHDTRKLIKKLEKINEYCSDHEERNWSVLENENQILDDISDMINILEKADPRVGIRAISNEDYHTLRNLITFYQMEARSSIRIALLKAIKQICLLTPDFARVFLQTCLPTELAAEFLELLKRQQLSSDRCYINLEVSSLIFCTGEPIPVNLYETFSVELFVDFLAILDANTENVDLVSLIMNAILAFNIHQYQNDANVAENRIQQALLAYQSSKTFVERLLLLFNKKSDPVWPYMIKNEKYSSSLLIMLLTLFSIESTANLFYSNDLLVLIDIVCREIMDLPAEELRCSYLELLCRMIENLPKESYHEKRSEIDDVIQNVKLQEADSKWAQKDREILTRFHNKGFNVL